MLLWYSSHRRLTLNTHRVQFVLVGDHVHVVQVGLDAANHLRLLEHTLGVGDGGRLLTAIPERNTEKLSQMSAQTNS